MRRVLSGRGARRVVPRMTRGAEGSWGHFRAKHVRACQISECCPNLPAIVLVSGDDCPNSLFEPSHESGVVGTPQRFTRVAQPNVDVRFALAGYVLE
jgi:hypothetical protein